LQSSTAMLPTVRRNPKGRATVQHSRCLRLCRLLAQFRSHCATVPTAHRKQLRYRMFGTLPCDETGRSLSKGPSDVEVQDDMAIAAATISRIRRIMEASSIHTADLGQPIVMSDSRIHSELCPASRRAGLSTTGHQTLTYRKIGRLQQLQTAKHVTLRNFSKLVSHPVQACLSTF